MSAGFWGSLLPAAWSFMLALRSRGLGSAWTTLHLVGKGEKLAADVLGIPFDEYSQGGLFPIAYTKGTDFRRGQAAARRAVRALELIGDSLRASAHRKVVRPRRRSPCWRHAS